MLNRRSAFVAMLSLVGCTRRNSPAANAKLIQLRMTEAQVEAILGAPSGSMLGGSDQDVHDLTYESGGDVIHVLFMKTPDYSGVAAVNLNGKQILSNSSK